MKYWVTYPLVTHPYDPAFVSKDAIISFAQAAERAGFDGIGFTDHPAPTERWLKSGGHDALDPFAALSFIAAVTERIRLIPNIVVLPYRNPFIVAKSIATIDALSGGRFTLSTAVGYMKAEYKALGVDYDSRNALFDEAIEVLKGIWSTDDFRFEGSTFTALGQTANPKPAHVPIWIGGNGARARQRVADVGDGWNPFPAPATLAATAKTEPLETAADLSRLLDDLWQKVDAAGRDRSGIEVSFMTHAGGSPGTASFNPAEHREGLAELAELGVTWNGTGVPGDSLAHALETLEQYGAEVINAG
ncbi:MAG TPA: LLM class F420-dependent oxidoreductase [Mycobacteriales bacterium]|nr:LLM class F420-dependent oxidoreductase [Mycobacteriales bacterium]